MIETAPLLAPLHAELLALLRGLEPDDWTRPTVAGPWRVREVAAHLMDGMLRKVAVYRDGHLLAPDTPIESPQDLTRLINGLNAAGVRYAARLSPRQIVDLLEVAGGWAVDLMTTLPPYGRAIFAVSWAGEAESTNWMDTGREYTEWWHHQMQIRDAVGSPLLLEPRWMRPLLDLSMHALPPVLAAVDAPDGTRVEMVVEGPTAGTWSVAKRDGRWAISSGSAGAPACRIHLSSDTAWRLLYNALPAETVAARVTIEGDPSLARPLLSARSVIV